MILIIFTIIIITIIVIIIITIMIIIIIINSNTIILLAYKCVQRHMSIFKQWPKAALQVTTHSRLHSDNRGKQGWAGGVNTMHVLL